MTQTRHSGEPLGNVRGRALLGIRRQNGPGRGHHPAAPRAAGADDRYDYPPAQLQGLQGPFLGFVWVLVCLCWLLFVWVGCLLQTTHHPPVPTLNLPRTTHQQLFDRLVLLSLGAVVYAGPIANVEPYFASLGYNTPHGDNPGAFFECLACVLVGVLVHAHDTITACLPCLCVCACCWCVDTVVS